MSNSTLESNFFFYFKNESSGKDYIINNKNLSILGGGFSFDYINDKFSLSGYYSNNRFYNETYNNFNPYKGFSWEAKHIDGSFDFDNSEVEAIYKGDSYSIVFGKSNIKIGHGNRSIILSNKAPSFPNLQFKWKISENLKFFYMHGILKSEVYDIQLNNFLYKTEDKSEIARLYVIHKIDYKLPWMKFPKINLGFSESVVYGGRGIDLNYLFPFNFYWSIQHYLGDVDNLQMHGYLEVDFTKFLFFYNILVDEWRPEETFGKNNRNWFGHHVGLLAENILLNDRFTLEFIWNDHRIYRHKFPINDYYSHGFPLGFWAGPHSQELLGIYEFDINSTTSIKFLYSNTKRGELTYQMIENQYMSVENSRFSGIVESKEIAYIEFKKEVYSKIFVEIGVSYTNWINAGFEPYHNSDNIYDESELIDIEKISINTSVFYNF